MLQLESDEKETLTAEEEEIGRELEYKREAMSGDEEEKGVNWERVHRISKRKLEARDTCEVPERLKRKGAKISLVTDEEGSEAPESSAPSSPSTPQAEEEEEEERREEEDDEREEDSSEQEGSEEEEEERTPFAVIHRSSPSSSEEEFFCGIFVAWRDSRVLRKFRVERLLQRQQR